MCFGDLPQPLASRIVSEALRLRGGSLRAWLELSVVCRAWQELMLGESVALVLPSDDVSPAQWQALRQWVRTTHVPVGSLRLGACATAPFEHSAGMFVLSAAALTQRCAFATVRNCNV